MSSYSCFDNLPVYSENVCEVNRLTGISAVGIIDNDYTFIDYTDAAEWAAAIAAGDVQIIKEIKANYPEAEEVTITNPRRGTPDILTKFNHTLSVMDANVDGSNDSFYEQLNIIGKFKLAWFYYEEDEIRVVEQPCRCIAKPAKADENDVQQYMVTFGWQSAPDEFPVLYTAPANIFE
jgi:hypothetical protein